MKRLELREWIVDQEAFEELKEEIDFHDFLRERFSLGFSIHFENLLFHQRLLTTHQLSKRDRMNFSFSVYLKVDKK